MSASKKSARSKAQGTDKPSGKSMASQSAPGKRKKPTIAELPDLDPIVDALIDAYSIVRSASYVLREFSIDDDEKGYAISALRQGVAAVGAAIDRLDKAEIQVTRFRESAGGAS